MTHSFQRAKQALSHTTLLAHPHPTAPLALSTDASDSHIGGVLQQQIYSHWQPLSFFSAKLSPTQQCNSTFDRELQAAYSAVLHFWSFLEGRPFLLLTDHKPLVAAFHRLSPPKSARQQRQLAFLSEFPLTIQHTSGLSNVVADALYRPPSSSSQPICPLLPLLPATSTPPFSPSQVAQQQALCPQTQQLLHSSTLQHAQHQLGDALLHGDVCTGHFRPVLSQQWCRLLCHSIINFS